SVADPLAFRFAISVDVASRSRRPGQPLEEQQTCADHRDDGGRFVRIHRKTRDACRADRQAERRDRAASDARDARDPRDSLGGPKPWRLVIRHVEVLPEWENLHVKAWSALHGQALIGNLPDDAG